MARRTSGRRVTGAWGNALGGFRRQKRDHYGRFTSGPSGGGKGTRKTQTFTKGGNPRYYAPGGKTYSTTRGGQQGFVRSTPSKAARRQAGYQRAMERKAAQQKAARRRKLVVGTAVVAAGVVGGAVVMNRRSRANGPVGPLAQRTGFDIAHRPVQLDPSVLGSGYSRAQTLRLNDRRLNRRNPLSSPDIIRNLNARSRTRVIDSVSRPSPAVPVSRPQRDDGFSAAKATVVSIGTTAGAAASVLHNVNAAHAEMQKMSRKVHTIAQDGVAEDQRHTPAMQRTLVPTPAEARLRLKPAPVSAPQPDGRYVTGRGFVATPITGVSSVKRRDEATMGSGGGALNRGIDEHGRLNPEVGRRVDVDGDPIANIKDRNKDISITRDESFGSGAGITDTGFRRGSRAAKGGIDIHDSARSKDEARIQAKVVNDYVIGPNAGRRRPQGKAQRSALQPVKITASSPRARREAAAAAGLNYLPKWKGRESDNLDAAWQYERNQAAKAGLHDTHRQAFPASKNDSIQYDEFGNETGVSNFNAGKFAQEAGMIKRSSGNNPIITGRLDDEQQASLNRNVGRNAGRALTGQQVPKTIKLDAPQPIPYGETGEKKAEQWLENINQHIAGGYAPNRYERQMIQFLTGERTTPPVKPEQSLSPEQIKNIHRRANRRKRARG